MLFFIQEFDLAGYKSPSYSIHLVVISYSCERFPKKVASSSVISVSTFEAYKKQQKYFGAGSIMDPSLGMKLN